MREIDPTLPVLNLRTQDEQIDRMNAQERLFARLSGFFGALALALAASGLYGLMSYMVVRRTGEIGLRMALGALPAQVLRMILRESLALVRSGYRRRVQPPPIRRPAGRHDALRLVARDPVTYGTVALVLVAIAVLASLLPARRASRIDPIAALRIE